jgi:glyceraldehyde-3-phosphate dehydrogenase (NADP+)
MKMFIGGEWADKDDKLDVLNPFDGSVVDTVPKATPEDVARAVATAEQGAAIMRDMPAYERYQILHKASRIMEERLDDLGRTITLEEGKILPESLGEAAR